MRELLVKTSMVKGTSLCAALTTSSPAKYDYEEILKLINSLQTNAAVLQQYKKNGARSHTVQVKNIDETSKFLARCGITLEKLDTLPVIHIAGTKGKGSTSAFCESILRHHGYKTGFFSSPHLVSVTERIRINGRPLSKHDFSMYAYDVYKKLNAKKESENDMPAYFKFLTTVSFDVFLKEKVDVAIVEVGIGGEYDCTNVLRKVQAVGITSLGVDHTSLLGNTIEEIAWQKAGIMKPGSIAFTTNEQPDGAMSVLKSRSIERQCPLVISPPIESYDWGPYKPELGIRSNVQEINASLALQLSYYWMKNYGIVKDNTSRNGWNETPSVTTFPITAAMASGLKYCQWPGRTQIIRQHGISYYVDGAHTLESIKVCTDWFHQEMQASNRTAVKRVLIFNATGDRDSLQLLEMLYKFNFDLVIFCPNVTTTNRNLASSDLKNLMITDEQQNHRCEKHKQMWLQLEEKHHVNVDSKPVYNGVKLLSCVSEALESVEGENTEMDVLVTGSLHLVGAVLSILDPDLTSTTFQSRDEIH